MNNKSVFVRFGETLRKRGILQQTQYTSRYANARFQGEYPNLGEGLRFQGDPSDYHALQIHSEDVDEFVRRLRQYLSIVNPFFHPAPEGTGEYKCSDARRHIDFIASAESRNNVPMALRMEVFLHLRNDRGGSLCCECLEYVKRAGLEVI